MTRPALLALLAFWLAPAAQAPPTQELDFVAVGVRYQADADPARRTIDLEAIRRARFNVAAAAPDAAQQTTAVTRLDRPLSAQPPATLVIRSADVGVVSITATTSGDAVRETAWTLFARGARGVLFDDWASLQQNTAAFTEASAFSETITRNMALYAPLRHVEPTGTRAVVLKGGQDSVETHWLESADALLLIAVNHGAELQKVTFTFPPEVPEAVWQNMLSGASVNFVAGPTGPFYEHTLPAHDVMVLMIRKRWK